LGLLLPAAIERFPDHDQELDPTKDTQIDLPSLGASWIHFSIGMIGKRITRDGGTFSAPASILNKTATTVDQMFGGIAWFLLPLTSSTMLFVIHKGPLAPPRTVYVRHEPRVGGKVHISYFE
jgi:hypothetical protein